MSQIYSKTTYVNGTTPAINDVNLNKAQEGIYQNSLNIPHKISDLSNTDNYIGSITNLSAYYSGLSVNMYISNNNTGPATLNLNSIGADDIKIIQDGGTKRILYANEMYGINTLQHDGTDWILLNAKQAVGEETLTEQLSIFSTATGKDGGDVSQDYNAVIEDAFSPLKVGGLSLVNSPENGDFSNGTTGWSPTFCSQSVVLNILQLTGDGSQPEFYTLQKPFTPASGDKLFYYAKQRVTNSDCTLLYIQAVEEGGGGDFTVDSQSNPVANTWYELYGIHTMTTTNLTRIVLRNTYPDAATANGKVMDVDGTAGVFAINMTALGISTYTEAQMLDLVRQGYFEGKKDVVNPNFTSRGKNLFDKKNIVIGERYIDTNGLPTPSGASFRTDKHIKVESNTAYTFSQIDSGSIRIIEYDHNENYIKGTLIASTEGSVVTDSLTANVGISSNGNGDDNINASQFEPGSSSTTYESHKISNLSIQDTFRSVSDSIKDEAEPTNGEWIKTQRIQYAPIANGTVINITNLTDAKDNGLFILLQDDGTLIPDIIDGGTTTTDDGDILYELAEPIITNITNKATGSLETYRNGTINIEGGVYETFTATATSQVLTEDFKELTKITYIEDGEEKEIANPNDNYTESTSTLTGLTVGETYYVQGLARSSIVPSTEITYALNKEARNTQTSGQALANSVSISEIVDLMALMLGVFESKENIGKSALVYNTTGPDYISTTVNYPFDAEDHDDLGFHDNVTNNSRLTIPAGVKKVVLRGGILGTTRLSDSTTITMIKNGSHAAGLPIASESRGLSGGDPYSKPLGSLVSGPIEVSENDYFELELTTTDYASDINSWFSIEVVE